MPWMRELSNHYQKMKERYPDDQLMVVFDIDDTIVDIRLPLLYVLKKYDYTRSTSYFEEFTIDNIVFEEWSIQHWLPKIIDDEAVRKDIVQFVRKEMWEKATIMLSHRPFRGVLEIIRWFQIQDDVEIGLNTGRSVELRDITLKSLNILGREFRVNFDTDLLYMNPMPNEEGKDITSYKAKGIQHFENCGYRVIAFIDNEPANLKAVADTLDNEELLLLHADTMFGSSRRLRPDEAVVGRDYEISEIVDPELIPAHIEFVWNGVNSLDVFTEYKESNVHWGEVDVRRHPLDGRIVLKHGSFDTPEFKENDLMTFKNMLDYLKKLEERGIKIVMKENEGLLDEVLTILINKEIKQRLWFDIIFEVFDEEGLEKIHDTFPNAIISTRIDFMVPLLSQFPNEVKKILVELTNRGITQYSISLKTYNKELFLDQMDEWGYDINIRDVYSLEDFLKASILLPESIVSTFNY